MTPSAALHETLNDIRSVAHEFRDDWWIIGSAAAHLAGADAGAVTDVDLLLSAQDAQSLASLWRECRLPSPAASKKFRSDPFCRFQRALPVEAMANFEMHIDGEWAPVRVATRRNVEGLFISEPMEQVALLRLMNREKDIPRIAALKAIMHDTR